MKKHLLLTTALILTLANPSYAAEEFVNSHRDLENLEQNFYEAPLIPMPVIKEVSTGNLTDRSTSMPVFKKTRIKITNYLNARDLKYVEKLLEKEKLEKENKEEAKVINENEKNVNLKIMSSDDKNTESAEASEITIVEGGIKEHVTSNEMTLDAENLDFFPERDEIEALGNPILVFPAQNITLRANKMIYNTSSNFLRAYGNVEIIKEGSKMLGDYIQLNMNEETGLIDNFNTKQSYLTITAKKANAEGNKLILENGKMLAEESYILKLKTTMIRGVDYDAMIIDDLDRSYFKDLTGPANLKIKAKDIYVNAKKEHDVITVKNAEIQYGEKKLFKIRSFTAHTNKNQDYVEANYPEFGSRSNLGMFAGPGFVFDIPNGATIKALPIINYKDKIGIGAALKYKSSTNMTDFAYGSSNDAVVMRGRQQLDDKLYLNYGINSYMEDWFLGQRLPKYMAELVYKNESNIENSIAKGLGLKFRQRAAAGYMQDSDFNRRDEDLKASEVGTTRFKYMAEIDQTLFRYANEEKRQMVDFGVLLQGSAALYGTGDTQFIGRVGPRIRTQYKGWMQEAGYFISGFQDNTPLTIYDTYRYGRSNVFLREAFRVNKYLTLAWVSSINLSDDSPNGKMFQENAFFVSVGPDDLKVSIGYDVVRQQTYFTIAMAMDLKGSSIDYEKMEIKNADRLSVGERKDEKLVVFEDSKPVASNQKMKYAEVIEIEDPNKEQL